jgi:hypothetical protein
MPAVVYPYAILGGRRSPLIPLGLGYQGTWQRVQAYTDGGYRRGGNRHPVLAKHARADQTRHC